MKSVRDVFYIGHGPSSSHTIGPFNATKYILEKYPKSLQIDVVLLGSLASTGKGHLTDYIIDKLLKDVPHHIVFNTRKKAKHPNTMIFEITLPNQKKIKEVIVSIGGGVIEVKGRKKDQEKDLYPHKTLQEILEWAFR